MYVLYIINIPHSIFYYFTGPLKKRRKQYLYDPEIEVPRSTLHYKKKKFILTDENIYEFTKEETQDDDNEVKEEFEDIQTRELLHCDNPKLPHQNLQGANTSCDQSDADISTETPNSSE